MASCCTDKQDGETTQPCSCEDMPDKGLKSDFPIIQDNSAVCCSSSVPEAASVFEKPGYRLWGFVEDFIDTPAGKIPRVRTKMIKADRMGTLAARLGVGRDDYRITPGLYCVGTPDEASPVMVTANYKLSFDVLRQSLHTISAWIMVVDTRGINVWCAAGKGTFSTEEVANRVKLTGLEKIVSHRRVIVPQLAATGVAARQVKKMCGFKVVWGPVNVRDIKAFLQKGNKASPTMRQVTFSFKERVELIPVELNNLGKPTLYLLAALFILSGIGNGFFSFSAAISRGITAFTAYLLAVMVGAILTPALLPWLPGRAFAIKGAGLGIAAGAMLAAVFAGQLIWPEMMALTLFIMAISSYLAMNFTGSTPFTSPTGVEKEMRKAIPAQAAGAFTAIVLWVGAGFMGP